MRKYTAAFGICPKSGFVLPVASACMSKGDYSMADPYKFLSGIGQQHLLQCIKILFNHDEDLTYFFFSHKQPVLRMPARCLVEEAAKFTQPDQLIIRVALDYWNRRGYARLGDMLSEWDHEYWLRFLHSLILLEEVEGDLMDRLNEKVPKR